MKADQMPDSGQERKAEEFRGTSLIIYRPNTQGECMVDAIHKGYQAFANAKALYKWLGQFKEVRE